MQQRGLPPDLVRPAGQEFGLRRPLDDRVRRARLAALQG